jgi:small-conductance mechanosensitive channel
MNDNDIEIGWADFWNELQNAFTFMKNGFVSLLFQPWGQIQIALLLVLIGAAFLLNVYAEPRFEAWIRDLETTRQRLRFLAVLLRRLRLIFFICGAWLTVLVMRLATWPSRSYLIGVIAAIATVWFAATLVGRMVRNRLVARFVTISIWLIAALYILGVMPVTISVLDAAAVSIGDLRVSLLVIVKSAIILVLLFWVAAIVSGFTERRVQKIEDMSPSMQVLTGKLVRVGLFTLAVIIGLESIGFNLTGLTVFSGAVGVGVGFGLQKVVSNLISGVILLLDKSIKPGDVIEVGNTFGWIATLGGRYVSVVTRDGREYLIPNEDLITSQVINWSHTDRKVRLEVTFGVSYDADPHEVRRIAIEAGTRPKRVLKTPLPVCHLTEYGAYSIDFVLRFWIADPHAGVVNIKGEVLLALWDALKENGIEIPFPRRDVEIRGPVKVSLETPPAPKRRTARKPKDT